MKSTAPRASSSQTLVLDPASRRLAVFLSVASIAFSGLWLIADIVADEGQLRQVQGWVLIPQIALLGSLIILSRVLKVRSLWVLAAFLVLVILEEHFHFSNSFVLQLEDRFDVRDEIPWQAFVVAPAALAVLAFTYLLAPPLVRRPLRVLSLFLAMAWFFGGPVNIAGRLLDDSRALQLLEEFGEAVAFSLAAGYGVALVISLARPSDPRPKSRNPR